MLYRNLISEMIKIKVTKEDLKNLLACSEGTIKNKLGGKTDFSYPEAREIQKTYFPGLRMEYLFDPPDDPPPKAG